MPRIARLVIPGVPHHVTQRGNRRLPTFFGSADYEEYSRLLRETCHEHGVRIWAYCLMPNHVHLLAVPGTRPSLQQTMATLHQSYSRLVNLRQQWKGHLWQGRFFSFPLSESHLMATARYIETNPVRAGLVSRPEYWAWSSARAHLTGMDDGLVETAPLLERYPNWGELLETAIHHPEETTIRAHIRTGRPLGEPEFVRHLETAMGRSILKGPRGRPRRTSPVAMETTRVVAGPDQKRGTPDQNETRSPCG